LSLFKTFLDLLLDGIFILRHGDPKTRGRIFVAHIKINLKHLFLVKLLRLNIQSEILLGQRVYFFNYTVFTWFFLENFVRREYLFTSTAKSPLIIDCGSNIGMATLFFKLQYPESRILAFEPDPKTFGMLKRNVEENHLTDVTLFNAALSANEGQIDFFVDPDLPGSPIMSTNPLRISKEKMRVRATILSKEITEEVDFLKMDIEGAEVEVMNELGKSGKLALVREMVIEYHHHISPEVDHLSQILSLLESSGFGYQLHTSFPSPFHGKRFQDILIYGYRKVSPSANLRPELAGVASSR